MGSLKRTRHPEVVPTYGKRTWPLFELPQRASVIREVRGVQHLNPRVVLAVEGRHRSRAPGILSVRERVEPQAQMIHLEWSRGGIHARIRERAREDQRSRSAVRCDGERLDAEDSPDVLKRVAILIGLDVSLIPGHPKRRLRSLEHKEVEAGLRGQTMRRDVQILGGAVIDHTDICARVREARSRSGRYGHIELNTLMLVWALGERCYGCQQQGRDCRANAA